METYEKFLDGNYEKRRHPGAGRDPGLKHLLDSGLRWNDGGVIRGQAVLTDY